MLFGIGHKNTGRSGFVPFSYMKEMMLKCLLQIGYYKDGVGEFVCGCEIDTIGWVVFVSSEA